MRDSEFEIAAFGFPKFENLLNESHQPGGVDRHDRIESMWLSDPFVQSFERGDQDTQRSHEFMGNIREELQLDPIQLLDLLLFEMREPDLVLHPDSITREPESGIGQSEKCNHVEKYRPPGLHRRR